MTQTVLKSDHEIQQGVLEALRWDGRVPATGVGVEVSHGTVTPAGTVNS